MNCDAALELISASLDGELTIQETAQLRAHLESCPHCRALLDELTGLHDACGPAWEAPPPEDLAETILANLPPQRKKPAGKGVYRRRWAALAAALAVVVLAAWQGSRLFSGGGKSADNTAAVSVPAAPAADAPESAEAALEARGQEAAPAYVADDAVSVNGSDGWSDGVYGGAAESPADEAPSEDADAGASQRDKAAAATTSAADLQPQDPVFGVSPVPLPQPTVSPLSADPQTGGGEQAPDEMAEMTEETVEETTGEIRSARYSSREVPETAPPMSETERKNKVGDLEETVEFADTLSGYCGVLTLDAWLPAGDYPAQATEDGGTCYTLPAEDFSALVKELRESGGSYTLRTTGDDISPSAAQGLVIVRSAP